MKKIIAGLAIAALGAASFGCTLVATPVAGGLYNGTQYNSGATANPVGAKSGESCAMSILGIIGMGDASAQTAAHAGGITKISHVDQDVMSILGIYGKYCTVVHGE